MGQLKMTLTVVQLFYLLLASFWLMSSHAMPIINPASGLLNGQNWLQSLIPPEIFVDATNSFLRSQSRQGEGKKKRKDNGEEKDSNKEKKKMKKEEQKFFEQKAFIPFTDIELEKAEDPENIWRDRWASTLSEEKILGNIPGDIIKGILRSIAWIQLDLMLYGPRTIISSLSGLFG